MKKIIIKILVIVVSLFLLSNKVYAIDYLKGFYIDNYLLEDGKEINRIKIKGEDSNIIGDDTAGNTYFKLAQLEDGNDYTIAYCSDGTKLVYSDDNNQSKVTMTKNCQHIDKNRKSLVYTFENGYNYSKYDTNYSSTNYLTGDYLKDYYITQSSVWYYTKPSEWMNKFNFTTNTYNGSNSGVITNITKLINDAEKAETGAKLNIEITDTKMTLTSDEKYYISKPIKITGTYLNSNISTSISGAEGAFVTTDKNATTGNNSFANNSTVYIKVPNTSNLNVNIKLTIKATNLINQGQIIECNHATNDDSQPMIIYAQKEETLSDSINISIHKYPVKITKKDITDSEEVEGATLTIRNAVGTTIETWVSDNNAKTIYLEEGKYTLEETIAPAGYIKSTSKIEFTIDNKGKVLVGGKEVSEIVITNEPILVTISKRSITGSDELKGAKLKITDKDGNIVKDISGKNLEWTSGDKPKTFNLKMGDYILSETIAPKGFELSETTIKFTINSEGKVLIDGKEAKENLIIFKNTPEPVQVPTGNTLIYIAGSLCLVALGVSIYMIIKRKEL